MKARMRTAVFLMSAVLVIAVAPFEASAATHARPATGPLVVYPFNIAPAGTYFNASGLNCLAPGCFDNYQMTVTSTTSVTITVTDMVTTGDNICLKVGAASPVCAISPLSVNVSSPVLSPATYTLRVGYQLPHPGTFPDRYTFNVVTP
jgi:hypothetical protein